LFVLACVYLLIACKHKQREPSSVKTVKPKTQTTVNKVQAESKNHAAKSEFQQKFNLSQNDLKENRLYAFVNEWYGTPYKYGGCGKNGVDCSCFTTILYQNVYKKELARTASDMFKTCKQISIEEADEGDLVFFKIGGNAITHVGVLVRDKYFVHSSTSRGVIINNLEEAYYKKYFFCAGKIKNA